MRPTSMVRELTELHGVDEHVATCIATQAAQEQVREYLLLALHLLPNCTHPDLLDLLVDYARECVHIAVARTPSEYNSRAQTR